jgi:type IV pilus assembly protein PilA
MKRVQQGFTLIELMIVVAIIGILAAIAIPQYQDYVTRSRWADAVTSVASLKTAIGECVQNNNNVLTSCNTTAELAEFGGGTVPTITKFTGTTVTVVEANAAIQIASSDNKLGGCTIQLIPTVGTGNISWSTAVTAGTGCTKAKTGMGT